MIPKKTYYSISEVSKMLNIQEHTIRFWDSKLPDLSKRDKKGKTRFFNLKQIEKLSNLNEILKKKDSITLAYEILSKKNNINQFTITSSYNYEWKSFSDLCDRLEIKYKIKRYKYEKKSYSILRITNKDGIIKLGNYIYQSSENDIYLKRKYESFIKI